MLADLLAASGAVGMAAEHFNPHIVPRGSRVRVGDYLVECTRKACRTGAFGTKLHWDQHGPFLNLLRGLRGSEGLSDRELVEAVLPEPRYLWIRREDVVAQAVSWWRAKTTRVWLDDDRPLADPTFDFEAIDQRVRMAREQNAGWRQWFEENGIEACSVLYEELVADPGAVARRALAFLGVDVAGDLTAPPRTRRQADGLNEEWICRYRELAEVR